MLLVKFCRWGGGGGGKRAVNFPKIGRVYQQSVFEKKTRRFANLTSKNQPLMKHVHGSAQFSKGRNFFA